jgi:hypothetical protein
LDQIIRRLAFELCATRVEVAILFPQRIPRFVFVMLRVDFNHVISPRPSSRGAEKERPLE